MQVRWSAYRCVDTYVQDEVLKGTVLDRTQNSKTRRARRRGGLAVGSSMHGAWCMVVVGFIKSVIQSVIQSELRTF